MPARCTSRHRVESTQQRVDITPVGDGMRYRCPVTTYRDGDLKLRDLELHEGLALGGLIRILIRLDGSFSEEEEQRLGEVADEVGDRDELWGWIERSAKELSDDEMVRDKALAVKRPGARSLIRHVLESIAQAGTITLGEQKLLDWLDDTAWVA